ncbi:MAG: hypothetical protein N2Z74_00080 [Syntrophales bacterium]|nr:hypothetical protein [Syntrophales bacterium]
MLRRGTKNLTALIVTCLFVTSCASAPPRINWGGQVLPGETVALEHGTGDDPIDGRLKKEGVLLIKDWTAAYRDNKAAVIPAPLWSLGEGSDGLKDKGIVLEPINNLPPELSREGKSLIYLHLRFDRVMELIRIRRGVGEDFMSRMVEKEEKERIQKTIKACKWLSNITPIGRPDTGKAYFGPPHADRRLDASATGKEVLICLYINDNDRKRPIDDPCSAAAAKKMLQDFAERWMGNKHQEDIKAK